MRKIMLLITQSPDITATLPIYPSIALKLKSAFQNIIPKG